MKTLVVTKKRLFFLLMFEWNGVLGPTQNRGNLKIKIYGIILYNKLTTAAL